MSYTDQKYAETHSQNRPRSNSTYLTAPMARGNSTISTGSTGSAYTNYSAFNNEERYGSPATAFSSANSPGDYLDQDSRTPSYPQTFFQEPQYYQTSTVVPSSKGTATNYHLGDPRDGDPKIHGSMYYDFHVSKNHSYWQLKEGYGPPSKEFPQKRPDETMNDPETGKRIYPCRHPECAPYKSFNRPWDLKRHFERHLTKDGKKQSAPTSSSSKKGSGSKGGDAMTCDYKVCPSSRHMNPFDTRKDHFREHYREVHSEDLVKRNMPQEKIAEWLASRQYSPNWWRCSKCLHKTRVAKHGWICGSCNTPCEECRIRVREQKFGRYQDSSDPSGAQVSTSSPSSSRRKSEYEGRMDGAEDSQLFIDQALGRSVNGNSQPGYRISISGNYNDMDLDLDLDEDDYEPDDFDEALYDMNSSNYPSRLEEFPGGASEYKIGPTAWNAHYEGFETGAAARGAGGSFSSNGFSMSHSSDGYMSSFGTQYPPGRY